MTNWKLAGRKRTFDFCQNQRPSMTLKGRYALCFKSHTSFGAHHEHFNEDKFTLSATTI